MKLSLVWGEREVANQPTKLPLTTNQQEDPTAAPKGNESEWPWPFTAVADYIVSERCLTHQF